MKQTKKHSLKSILIWGILGLFVISGFLQGNLFGVRNPVVAYVGKAAIRANDVHKYTKIVPVPAGMDPEAVQTQNYIFIRALEMLIQRTLITQECKRLGFVVSDSKVVDVIKKQPQFQIDGKFSRSLFLKELGKFGLSEMEYRAMQKESLLHRQWFFLLESAYAVPDKIAEIIASAQTQKRTGRYFAVEQSKIKAPKPNNAQLTKFFNDHQSLFRKPETKIYQIYMIEKPSEKAEALLQKQHFAEAIAKSKAKLVKQEDTSSALIEFFDALNLKIGQNSKIYYLNGTYYTVKVINIIPSSLPELAKIRNLVEAEYTKQYREQAAKTSTSVWIKLTDIKLNETYLGVPSHVINTIFLNPVGSYIKYTQNGTTYHVMVDKITPTTPSKESIAAAKEYLKASMLNDVVSAAINSLKLRYSINVLI